MDNRRGFTMVEMVIGLLLALIVLLALGDVMRLNQRAYGWGRDKIVLQQNASDTLDRLGRLVRMARSLRVVSPVEFQTFDESQTLAHTVRRVPVGVGGRIQQDGIDMVPPSCTRFDVTPNRDTTMLTIALELEDLSGNRVLFQTRTAVRNRDFEF